MEERVGLQRDDLLDSNGLNRRELVLSEALTDQAATRTDQDGGRGGQDGPLPGICNARAVWWGGADHAI